MSDKLYTVAEANALLPYLAPTLVELREKYELAEKARESMARAAAGNGWSEKRERWSATMARVAELLERLEEWGVELRDLSTGLVDFPALMLDEEIYLCWRLGEPEVGWYHPRSEGFGGRKRLL
ncbi:MAG TPA: DUF2203 domain-containing protein [Actinomycetota bacterium]|nr:DUF2203 domain-containing protein [Actinomycetota bacterium]